MSRVRSVLAWFVFIAGALALPATTVGVHEGRVFRCQHSCVTPVLSKWPTGTSRKTALLHGRPTASRIGKCAAAKRLDELRDLNVIDSDLRVAISRDE